MFDNSSNYPANSAKALKHNPQHFCRMRPVCLTFYGLIETARDEKHKTWIAQVCKPGCQAS